MVISFLIPSPHRQDGCLPLRTEHPAPDLNFTGSAEPGTTETAY
jgi:hypothetical protein